MCYSHDAICRRYDLAPGEFEVMVVRSGGICAICEQVPAGSLHVDHNHETGAVRALICSKCNFLLGNADEDPDRLLAAAAYLLQFQDVLAAK